MNKFISESIPKLNPQNNQYLEITFGKYIDTNIFDTKLNKNIYNKIRDNLQENLIDKTRNLIQTKIYFQDDLSLYINDQFQPKCFKENLISYKIIKNKINKLDINLKVASKKMLSIDTFPSLIKYNNEIFKKIESYNIQNKFFLNFVTNIENGTTYNTISILITKKNSKVSSILSLVIKYISLLTK